jgi:uncharacterized protein YacL
MPGKIFSVLVIGVLACFGSLMGYHVVRVPVGLLYGSLIGVMAGLIVRYVVTLWLRTGIEKIIGGFAGLLLGSVLGILVGWPASHVTEDAEISRALYGLITIVCALVGLQVGSMRTSELAKRFDKGASGGRRIIGILDTSVIIDGRIADVCETGFLSGELIIPEFVLKELQAIADSSEALKRTRGRRGLDILHKIQKQAYVSVVISDTDYPAVKEVDLKLLNLAREKGCPILTNDFNLNKVAEVHSLQVLNMNQLANALKPVVLPGETIKVQVIKEGKEHGQGVAYLDDGTMVVIDAGRHFMGRTVEVTVTSVLQTTAGRMIFGTVKT